MLKVKQYNFRNFNIALIVIVTVLSVISAFTIRMADGDALFKKQLFGLVLGLIIVLIVSMLDYHFVCRFVLVYYAAVVVLLVLTRFSPLGTDNNTSSYRWIDLGPIQIQSSELAKIAVILILAVLFVKLEERMDKFSTLVIATVITMIPTSLILVQSDLS